MELWIRLNAEETWKRLVIGLFGESCTGKSAIAEELLKKAGAKIYTGRDYLRLSKSEADAGRAFSDMLKSEEATDNIIVYVISEKEHLGFLPEKAVRILVTAGLDTIKERFAKRMNGNLPGPVASMLEKKYGLFDNEKHDLRIESDKESLDGIYGGIAGLCGL